MFEKWIRSKTTRLVCCVVVVVSTAIAGACDEKSKSVVELYKQSITHLQPVNNFAIEMFDVAPGELKKATVLLHNKIPSGEEIKLLRASLGCKCTTAKIPESVIKGGGFEKMDFEFQVAEHPSRLREEFHVEITTEGACSFIVLKFYARVKDFVGFRRRDHIQKFSPETKSVAFDLPLLVSDTKLLERVRVELADELSFVHAEVVNSSDVPYIRCVFDSARVVDNSLAGEIRLVRGEKTISSLVCFLEPQLAVELLPSRLIFTPSSDKKFVRTATALVKLGRRPDAQAEISDIECKGQSGNKLESSYVKMSPSLYRLNINVRDLIELGDEQNKLSMKVTLSTNKIVQLDSEFSLSN